MRETILSLSLDKDTSKIRGKNLRKAICALFPGDPLFSQHEESGKTIKRYPLIQYRLLRNKGVIIYGVNEGADMLEKIHSTMPKTLRISTEYGDTETAVDFKVVGKSVRISEFADNLMGKTTLYRTVTPLVLIDRKDRHEAYMAATSPGEKAALLQGWLVNNLVNIAHELKVSLPAKVIVPLIELNNIEIKKKGIEMIGLKGQFATNMRIGNLGIGRFCSHGFGMVQKIVI